MYHVDPRILKARMQLVTEPAFAFFGTLLMHLAIKVTTACATMATDGSSLWYNPAFFERPDFTPDLLRFILAHEVMHCALGHHTRRGNRDPRRWNRACDHVVNLILKRAGFVIPPNRYCDPRFDGFNAEQVYRILEDEEKQQQDQQQSDPDDFEDGDAGTPEQDGDGEFDDSDASDGDEDDNDGDDDEGQADDDGSDGDDQNDGSNTDDVSGDGDDEDASGPGGDGDTDAGGDVETNSAGSNGDGQGDGQNPGAGSGSAPTFHGDPGECGEVIDAAPAHEKAALDEAQDEWEVFTRQAVNIAKRMGEGRIPGYLEEVVEHLNDPRTDWREVYRRFVDPYSTTKDYSWCNPNRRMLSMGYVVPGTISDGVNHVVIAVDASYSIDSELLKTFGGEVQDTLDNAAVDKITLVWFDTRVTKTAEYTRGDVIDWEIPGRGGTAYSPVIAWIRENVSDAACALVFTDLDCTDYGPAPDLPVLWAGYGNPLSLKGHMTRVPWGECVEVVQ